MPIGIYIAPHSEDGAGFVNLEAVDDVMQRNMGESSIVDHTHHVFLYLAHIVRMHRCPPKTYSN